MQEYIGAWWKNGGRNKTEEQPVDPTPCQVQIKKNDNYTLQTTKSKQTIELKA